MKKAETLPRKLEALRSPDQVMRLNRLGSFHQCRLSFMRILLRHLAAEQWTFSQHCFEIDENGVGCAVYSAKGPERTYSLVAFAHNLPEEKRSDRVIADAWDATFTLFDGIPTQSDLDRLSENVPFQEAGRLRETELSLSRANRSVRLWDHVVEALSKGHQPDIDRIEDIGYLMRTTAVYGSGKFGAADRETICDRAEMKAPFQAEMLSVYLTRWFVRDLVQHMAWAKGGDDAVHLHPDIASRLGIGNSTGLGMAPFIINHPILFNNWILARETAIATVRSLDSATDTEIDHFLEIFHRASKAVGGWKSDHSLQQQKLAALGLDIRSLEAKLSKQALSVPKPWNQLMTWGMEHLTEEGQEFLASLILEPYGSLVDELSHTMADFDEGRFRIRGDMSIAELRALLMKNFDWALEIDWAAPENNARVWYVSEEKLEPRLGERFQEDIAPYEQPLAPARDAVVLLNSLGTWEADALVADFVLKHPEHRHTVRRAQITQAAPYSEVRDNTVSADLVPIDMLRAKLSFFGATQFDPRSDRWLRICMFAGAPYPENLSSQTADFWVYPTTDA